jgi:DNA-directed RNA polymerase subunit RPC12/RpoP
MDESDTATTVVYICWDCGGDFDVSEHDGLTDSLEVVCPGCGSDLVAVDFAAVRRRRPASPLRPNEAEAVNLPEVGEAC